MIINLDNLFTSLGIVGGNVNSKNQYDFYKGIQWGDGEVTNTQYDFFKKIGMSRYDFFKQYINEREFYRSIDDNRIFDFKTFYKHAGEYLIPITPTDIWILETGFWNDENVWVDDDVWIDGELPPPPEPEIFIIGEGTGFNTANQWPTPYGNFYWGNRTQSIYTVDELLEVGLRPGDSITTIGYNVINLNSVPTLNEFIIKIKNTTITTFQELGGNFEEEMITVLPTTSYTPILGWNLHTLIQPFVWDGTSNLVVETCSQNNFWTNSGNASVQYSSVVTGTTLVRIQDALNTCSNPTGLLSNLRSNLKLVVS
jgi:hypothetical protein